MGIRRGRPALSICIPTYNRRELLARALDSALAQAAALPGQVEVLVLDNASTDGTPAMLRVYRGRAGLRLVRHRRNLGMVGNWNAALGLAKGRLLTLLHDDDLLLPGYAAAVLEGHARHPEVAFSFGGFRVYGPGGRAGAVQRPLGGREQLLASPEAFAWIFHEFGPVTMATVAFDRARLRAAGGFKAQAALAADGEAYLRLAARWPALYRADIHAGFGFHGGNLQLGMTDQATLESFGRIAGMVPLPPGLRDTPGVRRRLAAYLVGRQYALTAMAELRAGRGLPARRAAAQAAGRLAQAFGPRRPGSWRVGFVRCGSYLPAPVGALLARAAQGLLRRLPPLTPSPRRCWERVQALATSPSTKGA